MNQSQSTGGITGHTKFKVFLGHPGRDGGLTDEMKAAVEKFASGVSSRSVGVEYLEAANLIVLSLGYRDDEPANAARLVGVELGILDRKESAIEEAMEKAATAITGDVLCHEFYVRVDGAFHMVLLVANPAASP